MNKESIRINSIKRMENIEDQFSSNVPPEVIQYYLLNFLITNGLRRYIDCHGFHVLDKEFCESGKELAGFGQLSFFEKDCITYLNDHIMQEEVFYERSYPGRLTHSQS